MCVSEAECSDELFIGDKQDYDYSTKQKNARLSTSDSDTASPTSPKKKSKEKKSREDAHFDINGITVADKEMEGEDDRQDRSVDMLSVDSNDPDSPRRDEPVREEPPAEIFQALIGIVSLPEDSKNGAAIHSSPRA